MKFIVVFLYILFLVPFAHAEESIVGKWLCYKMIYQGHDMPEPADSTLRLYFSFDGQGQDHLYWYHEGQADSSCSRLANYSYDGKILHEEVSALDPKNSGDCGRDPDMQLGKVSDTPLAIVNGELQLSLPLGDDTLVYVWRRAD